MNTPAPHPTPETAAAPRAIRADIRAGRHDRHTAGLAPGYLQGNLVILPEGYMADFLRFCTRNPRPCPVISVGDKGDPRVPLIGSDIDVRTDVPRYRVYRDGALAEQTTDISRFWRDDLAAVVLGCSFTFERALQEAGYQMRHIDCDRTVPMYRTTIACRPAGPFRGNMVVSMRPLPDRAVPEVARICARFPLAHGAPIHAGDPAAIGIADLDTPDWGDPPVTKVGEIPVFWACGVTPQNVILDAGPPLFITHEPGHMLITDIGEGETVPPPPAPAMTTHRELTS